MLTVVDRIAVLLVIEKTARAAAASMLADAAEQVKTHDREA